MGRFNHKLGSGFVPAAKGDYHDALRNRKARVHLLVHETTGAFSPYAAMRLRRLGRLAVENGVDGTDYTRSYTARSFVPYYNHGAALRNHNIKKLHKDFGRQAVRNYIRTGLVS